MAATAGYLATVSVTGTATTMTGEAMGGAGVTYQITSTSRQIVDPNTAITVKVGGAAQAPSTYSFDYLTGTVVFGGAPGAAVTIDGKFLPAREIAQAYEMDVSLSRTLAESSLLGSDFTQRTPVLGDITGTFACYDSGLNVYTDVDLAQILVDGSTKVVQMAWNATNVLRFFAMFESIEASGSVDGVQTANASFSMNGQTALTTGVEVDFSFT
tara:strand:+ start:649 stop:1287 length:639 start_codon:yes stop_codon:yes gene_type:complete